MNLRFSPDARSDLTAAYDWYNRQRLGLGEDFLQAVQARVAAVAEWPLQFPMLETKSERHFRYSLVRRFPYRIVFEIQRDDTVIVLAVAHTSRDPQVWQRRLD